jgi:hypothetical protein
VARDITRKIHEMDPTMAGEIARFSRHTATPDAAPHPVSGAD